MKFTDKKIKVICEKLFEMKEQKLCGIENILYCETGYKTADVLPAVETLESYSKFNLLEGKNRHYWFYCNIEPQTQVEGKTLWFSTDFNTTGLGDRCDCEPQCIVFVNGEMRQSLDVNHPQLELDFCKEYEIFLHIYTGSWDRRVSFDAYLSLIEEKIEQLYYDLHVPYEAAMCLIESDEKNANLIFRELNLALDNLDLRVPFSKEFYASVDATTDYLYENFYNGVCGDSDSTVSCIGHTHIDVAWLWPLEQTEQKAQRSFATVLELMEKYPEYKFMSSQPQLYEYVKKNAPEVYEKIKERVRDGRWEVEGGMWVECDCNLSSGESLIRQILHGKKFMKDEFGVESKCVWLPDVFGYSAAMPQIMKKCGIDYFVTSKISWSEFNKMPYDSFMWEGIDGSEIFTYFMTAQNMEKNDWAGRDVNDRHCDTLTTYNAEIDPRYVKETWDRYQQKEYSDDVLLSFGFGDGGGGPTKDMLEQYRRLQYGIPGLPMTKMSFAKDFFAEVHEKFLRNSKELKYMPKWVGELYLELHRGTYTSIAKIKKCNRKGELMYQTLEKLSSMDKALTGGEYNQEEINKAWRTMLLHQFHDVLPGSSIKEVYDRTDKDFAEIFDKGSKIIDEKIAAISSKVETDGGIFVYNPNGFECSDVIDADGKKIYVENIPTCGYKVIKPAVAKNSIVIEEKNVETPFYTITFDENFNIVSLYDKENDRQVVKPGEKLNELQMFEDYPKKYDAWEISNYYKEKMWTVEDVTETEILDEGARKGIKITRNCLNSKIVQTIWLYEDIRRIDFDTYIDWKEEHILLKAAFPFDVHANEATYDIQFGNLKRSTHENTSWDKAKFEVCAHKWADISEDGYGVALLNDCKYGHSAEGSTLKLTLLKSATFPNPSADKEEHAFSYSIVPHSGSFKDAGIAKLAQSFNQPMIAKEIKEQRGTLSDSFSFVSANCDNIMIDTVKKAESEDATIIRLYEYFDRRTKTELTLGIDVKAAYLCDMLENNIKELEVKDNKVKLEVSNFEIVTVKIIL